MTNLDQSIDALELSIRSMNALKYSEIHTIKDLVKSSKKCLLRTPNFGRKSLREVEECLSLIDLKLNMSDEDLLKYKPQPSSDIEESNTETNGNGRTIKYDLNYDILKVAKEAFIKSHRRIIYKTDWTPEEVKDFFNDHQSVLNTYRQSINELFYN
jgi:hypothetical protein|tara:strand:- start:444 stop:911 length:468 start_codon:yes stop_codon:yes gene_type:complete